MAKYKSMVITTNGLKVISAAQVDGAITFTAIKSGSGTYDGTEDLSAMTELKEVKQTFGITGITRSDSTTIKVRSVFSNEGVTEGYSISEIGLFARDAETGAEVLYAVIVAEEGLSDYFPAYADAPTSATYEIFQNVSYIDSSVEFKAEIVEGTYVTVQDFEEHRQEEESKITSIEEMLTDINTAAMLYRGDITADTTDIETLPLGVYGVGNVKGLAYNIKPYSYVYKANSSNMYGSLMVLFQSGDARGVYHFDASVNEFRRTVRADELDGSKVACEVFTDFTVDGVTYSNSNAEVRYLYMTNSNNSRLFELGYVTSTSDATVWEKYIVPNKLVCRRYVDENGWSEWSSVALNTDLSGYLPLNGNARGLGIDDTAGNRLITQAYTGTKTTNDGRMYVQADHNNKCVNVGILGLGAVGVNRALCDKNGNQIDTTYATKANVTPVFSTGGSYSTLADFMTAAQNRDTCGSSNVFGKFKDSGGWTGSTGWYRAWVSWENRIGNGLWDITGIIILLTSGTYKIGVVSGGKTDASDLAVTWYDVATSADLAPQVLAADINTSVALSSSSSWVHVVRSGNVVTVDFNLTFSADCSDPILVRNLPTNAGGASNYAHGIALYGTDTIGLWISGTVLKVQNRDYNFVSGRTLEGNITYITSD